MYVIAIFCGSTAMHIFPDFGEPDQEHRFLRARMKLENTCIALLTQNGDYVYLEEN